MLGWINVDGTWAQWVGQPITVGVLTILLVVELVTISCRRRRAAWPRRSSSIRLIMGGFAVRSSEPPGLHLQGGRRRDDRRVLGTLSGARRVAARRRRGGRTGRSRVAEKTRWPSAAASHRRVPRRAWSSGPPWREIRRDHRRRRPGRAVAGGPADGRRARGSHDERKLRRDLRQHWLPSGPRRWRQRPRRAIARRGAGYGFGAAAVTVDMENVKARKERCARRSRPGVE